MLQEIRIRLGKSTPFYLDSNTTVFVAESDTAIKKSAWLIRRADVLKDGVKYQEIQPIYISEADMAADPFTKYLVQSVWARHRHFFLNLLGTLPER